MVESRYRRPADPSQFHGNLEKPALPRNTEPVERTPRRQSMPSKAVDSYYYEEPHDSDRRGARRSRASPPRERIPTAPVNDAKGQESSDDSSKRKRRSSGDKKRSIGRERETYETGDTRLDKHHRIDTYQDAADEARRSSRERANHEPKRSRDSGRRESHRHRSEEHEYGGPPRHYEPRSKSLSHPRRSSSERHDRDLRGKRRSSPSSSRSGSLRGSLVVILLKSASILRHMAHRHSRARTSRSVDPIRSRRSRKYNDLEDDPELSPPRKPSYRKSSRSRSMSSGEFHERERYPSERRRHRESADDVLMSRPRRDIDASSRHRQLTAYTPDGREVLLPQTRSPDGRYIEPAHAVDDRELT